VTREDDQKMQQASELREKNAKPAPEAVASNRLRNRTEQGQHLPIVRDAIEHHAKKLRLCSMLAKSTGATRECPTAREAVS